MQGGEALEATEDAMTLALEVAAQMASDLDV